MSQLFSWVISKPELLISVLGWLVTYWFVIRAQAKQHKNEINHEIYKELIQEFYKFLQKWESYEIFVQDLQKIMLIFKKENDKVFEEFQNIFLLQDPEAENNKDEKGFEARLDALWEVSANVSCYLMDFKKVLQNYFYKQYGLKALKPRATEDSKYLVLTEKGLVETTK